ncbi:MAG: hypothetical protein JKY04_02860 [Sneathiella sp.]|nr:hypothetical protein [Sneathiella sp.]
MILKNLFGRGKLLKVADALYTEIVRQARQPVFYLKASVPDTVDGRFEMISLHAFLVMRRLKNEDAEAEKLQQAVFDRMFTDMDHSIREIGVGDLSVGKRIKAMAEVFYGRIIAYETALDGGDESLETALERNHYGTLEKSPDRHILEQMSDYVRRNDELLKAQPVADLKMGSVQFAEFESNTSAK